MTQPENNISQKAKIDGGGPAFPSSEGVAGYGGLRPVELPNGHKDWEQLHPGMTLRDYFAAKALQGYCARGFDNTMDVIAEEAYRQADAMIRARTA